MVSIETSTIAPSAMLTAKHHSTPTPDMRAPPSAGPTMREPFMAAEFSPIALERSSRSTRSETKVIRTGMSKVSTTPNSTAAIRYGAGVVGWVKATAASATAEATRPTLVVTSSLWLSRRSATRPAMGLRTIAGPKRHALATPTARPLSVISNTAQMTASRCIQVPIWLTVWPMTKMR